MKKKNLEDLDFDFDLEKEDKPIGQTGNTLPLENSVSKGDLIHLGGTSLDLSDECLIIRVDTGATQTKHLIYLTEIESTIVSRKSNKTFLFLAIFLFLLCVGFAIPAYFFIMNYVAFALAGAGVILFILFMVLYSNSKGLILYIYYGDGKRFPIRLKSIKSFTRLNEFFDELFHRRSKLR